MSRRPHCRCTAVRNYRYQEAAEKLGCKPQFPEFAPPPRIQSPAAVTALASIRPSQGRRKASANAG